MKRPNVKGNSRCVANYAKLSYCTALPGKRREDKSEILCLQVRSAQSPMCGLILEIDKERAMCQAQVENNTTGMWAPCFVCLVLLHFGGCHYSVP